MPFKPATSLLPLTPLSFEVLMALSEEPLHGYAILQVVETRLAGLLPFRTGTLYRGLARLLESGLIGEVASPEASDERRRYYDLTELGHSVLRAEAERLAGQVDAARARHLLPGRPS